MNEICLIVIYNHNFERNIEVIKHIYEGRFSHVYQVMPFYRGNDPTVIGVYECSYQFNGYITQAAPRFKNDKYSHYVFVADDMVLNPKINESNILEYLKLSPETGFHRSFTLMTNRWAASWQWGASVVVNAQCCSNACQWWNSMPTVEAWRERFTAHGIKWQNGYDKDLCERMAVDLGFNANNPYVPRKLLPTPELVEKVQRTDDTHERGYPLVFGFSDFFVIPATSFDDFVHYCGVFAAMRMFVEAAIPTSMILSCSKIVNLSAVGLKAETGVIDAARVRAELESNYELSFAKLMREYPEEYLFIHPIKLSKWKDLP